MENIEELEILKMLEGMFDKIRKKLDLFLKLN